MLYAIGGTNGNDDKSCNPGASAEVYGSVEKIDTPGGANPQWVGGSSSPSSPPDLTYPRYNHNSILLLDGSILVNGGWDGSTHPDAEPAEDLCLVSADPILPERYRPPELFTTITEGGGADVWATFDVADPHHRRYHSVAGLLPDGRVFSVGGDFPDTSYHSVSLYSPPYCFFERPVITSYPVPTGGNPVSIGIGTSFPMQVQLTNENNVLLRVALVRNGSITHAWDMNQRYVVLGHSIVGVTGTTLDLTVQGPVDGYMAPPGYYFLTVVEESTAFPLPYPEQQWVPSPGVWVRVE